MCIRDRFKALIFIISVSRNSSLEISNSTVLEKSFTGTLYIEMSLVLLLEAHEKSAIEHITTIVNLKILNLDLLQIPLLIYLTVLLRDFRFYLNTFF